MITRKPLLVLVAAATATLSVMGVGTSNASIRQRTVVSVNPSDFTPNLHPDAVIRRPIVFTIAKDGRMMYAGGRFHSIASANRRHVYRRHNIVSFDAKTGAVNNFKPKVNGDVWSIVTAPGAVYIGGRFTSVNGLTRPAIAKLDPVTGAVDTGFAPPITRGRVTEMRMIGDRRFIAGSFTRRLMAVDPATGADTGYIRTAVTGRIANTSNPGEVFKFAVSPDATRLVAVGNFTDVDGAVRNRAFMLKLDPSATVDGAKLSRWYYPPLDTKCSTNLPSRIAQLKDVDFSPDGSYFVMVATGFVPAATSQIGSTICDAAARFETRKLSPTKPTWINYTGGDTLHSVAITGAAVYVQGHNRWLDNPYGQDSKGLGAVYRPGGGAIDPHTGKALPWKPVKKSRVGGYDFLVTPGGLWVASDGKYFHGEYRYGIAFCPL